MPRRHGRRFDWSTLDLDAANPGGAAEDGPRIVVFSGGTAGRGFSRVLKTRTHNSTHLVTPFDSGGSSASLRSAFRMLSVGDLRNRLIALADETMEGNPEVYGLFTHRLGQDDRATLMAELERMAGGSHPLVAGIAPSVRRIVMRHLESFRERMPASFDLRGASMGNLVLVGGYLSGGRDIDAVLAGFSTLLAVRGTVRPIVDADLHLRAELADGSTVSGQHRITGKETAPIRSPIRDVQLVRGLEDPTAASVTITEGIGRSIREAELICYPIGSFWTSVVANLLPGGVGAAIAGSESPKVYVPNTADDPELLGTNVQDCVAVLHRKIEADIGAAGLECAVDTVLVDTHGADYHGRLDVDALMSLGIDVVDAPLVTERSRPLLDPKRLAEALLSLSVARR